MSLFSAVSFSAFIFKNKNLATFSLLHDRTVDNRILNNGPADFDIIPIRDHQNLVKGYVRAYFTRYFFYFQGVAFLYPILFSA